MLNIASLSRILQVALWLGTLGAATVWVTMKNPPFDPEPVTVILGLVSTAVSALISEYASALDQEKYSTSFALAYGYVSNFIDPVISQLISNSKEIKPLLFIYMPQNLHELEVGNIKRVMAQIRGKQFSEKLITLNTGESRTRDLISILKDSGQQFYFDFPTTLLTLNSLIDYKLHQRHNQLTREELGKQYIIQFKQALDKMLKEKNLADFIKFTNKSLDSLHP